MDNTLLLMIIPTEEDEIKSRIAEGLKEKEDLSQEEYCREFQRRYEELKYSRNHEDSSNAVYEEDEIEKEVRETRVNRLSTLLGNISFRIFHHDSLEEKLSQIAQEHCIADKNTKRRLDLRAYKTIIMCRNCRENKKLARYYYKDFYRKLKNYFRIANILENGVYIDYQEESIPEDFNFGWKSSGSK